MVRSVHLVGALVAVACGGPGPAPVVEPSAPPSSDESGAEALAATDEGEERPSAVGPVEVPPELRIFPVVVDEALGESLERALSEALDSPPQGRMSAGGAADLAMVIRRPSGECTYVWNASARARYLRWLRALAAERSLDAALVAYWDGGSAVLQFEGLSLVGDCPGRPGVRMPAEWGDEPSCAGSLLAP